MCPDFLIHQIGEEFTLDNSFRGGDLVTNLTGVLDHRIDGTDQTTIRWRVAAPAAVAGSS